MGFNDRLINLPGLNHVINRSPLTISADSFVVEAIVLMSRERCINYEPVILNSSLDLNPVNQSLTGCILVVEGGNLLGIFTQKDVLRLIASGIDLSTVRMSEVMTQPVVTLRQSDSQDIFIALSLLRQYQTHYLPVLDDRGQLLGIITETSLLQAFDLIKMVGIIEGLQQYLQKSTDEFRQVNQPIEIEQVRCQIQNNLRAWVDAELATLRQAYDELEQQVAELVMSNVLLQQEISDRQRVEVALRQSENLYRQLVESQTDIIIRIDLQGLITFANVAACQTFGWKQDDFRGLSFLQFFHPDDLPKVMGNITALASSSCTLSNCEQRTFTVNGIRWFQWSAIAIHNHKAEIVEIQGVGRDITEYKQVEESLRQSEARLSLATEAVQMGIWDRDLIANTTIWSANMGPLYGLPSNTLCPNFEDYLNLIHPEDREFVAANIAQMIGEGKESIEYRVIWPDGSQHYLSCKGQVYYNEIGQPIRIISTNRDVTERKLAEQQISEQAALLDIATDAILVRDFQSQILFWNKGAERMYGWLSTEVIGKNLQEILYLPGTEQQLQEPLKSVIDNGSWQGELHKVTKSGEEIFVESRWTLMRDPKGEPKSVLTVDTDITQKKQLQEQFFRAQRLESLGTLAGGIAHDLNNILTPILAAAQLVQGKYFQDNEHSEQLLGLIESNAKRGAALVKQVLSFARGFKGERTIIQVKYLISEIIQIVKQTFPKSIEFSTVIPEDICAIAVDTTQLHQVLMNLVVNARDALPDGGNIKISVENKFIDEAYTRMNLDAKVGHYIVITVADNGIGIPPEILDRIFEPFFTTKGVNVGTGLGLSTVLGIIKSHDGFIKVSSNVGRGSKFDLFLPAVEATLVFEREDVDVLPGEGELILVVDDEAQIREIDRIILENHNYKILAASNGIEAIALYAQHKHQINAVLMDIMMPEMDGITAIRTLQKINNQVQIIACSGLNSMEVFGQRADANVQAVLSKPYTARELLKTLHHLFRGSE
ncbi:PAS domain S-box protein [Nostoc sp. KVJ3]|nr:PAS domain S-box protein [Nostoc sp. KVJ3]